MSPLDMLHEPIWQRLACTLLHFVWQGLAVALGVTLLLWVVPSRRAQIRYAFYLAGLLLMAACPIVTFVLVRTPTLTAHPERRNQSTRLLEAMVVQPSEDGPPASHAVPSEASLPGGDAGTWQNTTARQEEGERTTPSVTAPTPRPDAFFWSTRISKRVRLAQPYGLIVWMVGVFLLSVRLMFSLAGVRRLMQNRHPVPAELNSHVVELGNRLGFRSMPSVFICERVREAVVVGILRPMVLLPGCWVTEMTPDALEAVIAHELAHIRRWDVWVNLLQRLVETLLFYHPAVWWLSYRLCLEREMCTDELAVEATGERMTYASTLELLGRKRLNLTPPQFGTAMGGGKMALLNRVRNILDVSPAHERARWWPVGLLALLVPLGIWSASTSFVQPAQGETQAEVGEETEDEVASKIGFDTVSVSFSAPMARQAPEHITINANGSCIYKIEGVPARGQTEARPSAKQAFQLGKERLRQMNGLLEKTGWFTVPASELPAPPGMSATEITMVRNGQTLSVTCHHRAPAPYASLLWFLRGVARQENLLYQITNLSSKHSWYAWDKIGSDVRAKRGKSGRAFPICDIDYTRYLPLCTTVVRNPSDYKREEVIAAIRLVTFLRAESEFDHIAAMSNDPNSSIDTVAEALADFGGERAVPVLAKMAAKSEEAIWGLIRLGDVAVPTLVEMIQKTESYEDKSLSTDVVRTYMEHWNELPRPVDQRVVAAARRAAPDPKPYAFGEYHAAFLKLIDSRPVPAEGLSCRIDQQRVYCPKPMLFVHGWYAVADGKIVRHVAAPTPPVDMTVFGLKFEVATDGGRPIIRAGWFPPRGPAGERAQFVGRETVIDVPEGSHLDVVYRYQRDKPKEASSFSPLRLTGQFRTLWEGQFVRDGRMLKRIIYAARVADPNERGWEFKPPSAPAVSMAEPPKPPRQVAFRGLDLTKAPKASDPAVLVDLEMARHSDAVPAEGGTPRYQAKAEVIYKSPFKKAPSQQFVVFHYPKRKVFYVLVEFRKVGKRVETVIYGPFNGDPFQTLDLPVPTGRSESRIEEKRGPNATSAQQQAVAALEKRGASVERDATGTVTAVSFRDTRATDADLPHLKALPNLRRLDLHSHSEDYAGFNQVQVTNAGLVHLNGLTKLEELTILGTNVTDAGLAHLTGLNRLKSLNAGYTKITDAGLAHVAKLTALETLSLEAAHEITDAGLLYLQGLDKLTYLHLDFTSIGDVGLKHLEPLGNLQSLTLYGAKVTDAGVESLARMGTLRALVVRRTKITAAGLKRLYDALPNTRIVADSNRPASTSEGEPASGRAATDDKGDADAAAALKQSGAHVELDEDGRASDVSMNGAKVTEAKLALIEGLSHVRSLSLAWTDLTDAELEYLRGLSELETLHLASTEITGPGLMHLRDMAKLRYLSLSLTPLRGEGLRHVSGLNNLRSLNLHQTKVSDDGLASLSGLANLEELTLSFAPITDTGVAHLNELTRLRLLDLRGTKITSAALMNLRGMTKLKQLDLRFTLVGDAGLESLERLSNLQSLQLGGTAVTDGGLQHLRPLANLVSLDLSGTKITDAGLARLKDLANLKALSLQSTPISDAGLEHLQALASLETLVFDPSQGPGTVTQAGIKRLQAALPGLRIVSPIRH